MVEAEQQQQQRSPDFSKLSPSPACKQRRETAAVAPAFYDAEAADGDPPLSWRASGGMGNLCYIAMFAVAVMLIMWRMTKP